MHVRMTVRMFFLLSNDIKIFINKSRMINFTQYEVAVSETQLSKISEWLLHFLYLGFERLLNDFKLKIVKNTHHSIAQIFFVHISR